MNENTIVLKRECVATRTGPRETETEAVVLWPWVRVILVEYQNLRYDTLMFRNNGRLRR